MKELTSSSSPVLRTDELIRDILDALGAEVISPEAVRACLLHLGDLIRDHTAAGQRVDIEWLGSFSRSSSGEVVFDDTEDPIWAVP